MTNNNIPVQPANSFRVTITLDYGADRLDSILLNELKRQTDSGKYKTISRSALKTLFSEGKITIKGQRAKPSSSLAKGVTYIDILEA
jgi:hypothetical protein